VDQGSDVIRAEATYQLTSVDPVPCSPDQFGLLLNQPPSFIRVFHVLQQSASGIDQVLQELVVAGIVHFTGEGVENSDHVGRDMDVLCGRFCRFGDVGSEGVTLPRSEQRDFREGRRY
jgi:hypothetical protein